MVPWTCPSGTEHCLSESLVQLVPTCIIVFSSLAVISAECGRQDRRRMFNRFSSEVVVAGESQADLTEENTSPSALLKPKRTFPLAILRCVGALVQIGLFAYLAIEKLAQDNRRAPGLPRTMAGSGTGSEVGSGSGLAQGFILWDAENNEQWPLWLPVMHGIVWVYAAILSIVSMLHPRQSNPYHLVTHLDIIYLTTSFVGLSHFMRYDFGRPIGLWSLDDQISGLSTLVSAAMIILTLATKPLVPPQPIKGSGRRSKGIISPETRSSLYARIAFTWLHPMVLKSFRESLQESDVWAMDKALRIKTVFNDYIEFRKPTVFYTMLSLFRLELGQQYLWALAWAGLNLVPPFVVFKLIQFGQDLTTYNRNEALFYVASLLVSIVIRSAVLQRGLHKGQRLSTMAMGMSSGLIYEKLAVRKDMDPIGYDISDLMAIDVKRVGHGWKGTFYLMAYPTVFIFAVAQLHGYIGHSAIVGGLAVIAWYPISALASFLFSGRFDPDPVKMERSNAIVSDLLANLKAIKFLGWEDIFMGKVLRAREEERKQSSKTSPPVMTLISVPLGCDLSHAFVVLVILSSFTLYSGQILTPAVLFTTLVLVDIQTNAINSLPAVIIAQKEMLESVMRINDFLGDDENEQDTVVIKDREMARRANIPIIGFVNATFVWPEARAAGANGSLLFMNEPEEYFDQSHGHHSGNSTPRSPLQRPVNGRRRSNWIVRTLSLFGYTLPTPPTSSVAPTTGPQFGSHNRNSIEGRQNDFALRGVSLSFPPNQVSLVTGTKKAGKSALLLALIGEMTRTSGKIYLPRKDYYHGKQGYGSDVAYVSQDPWLEIGGGGSASGNSTGRSTIRDTILFGLEMDEQRYAEVLRGCVLEDELRGLSRGDKTVIGDKNVIWSMSLKQRIALARAIYSDVSHILMDDCLSFVDVKSRQYIWKNCLLGPLAQTKTRILVTNQLHIKTYLNDVDYVVGLDQGTVLGHGTVKDVLSQGWIRHAPGSSSLPTTIIPGASVPANLGQLRPDFSTSIDNAVPASPVHDAPHGKASNLHVNKLSTLSDYDDLDSTLSRETAAGFKVGWSTFGTYILSSGSGFFLLGSLICLFVVQALFILRIGWLGVWTENETWNGGAPLRGYADKRSFFRMSQEPDEDSSGPESLSPYDYLIIFVAMAGVRALFLVANAFFVRQGAQTGADSIYARLLHAVLSARLMVFEATSTSGSSKVAGPPSDAGGLFTKGALNSLKDCFQRDLVGLDVKLAKEFWQFACDFMSVTLILLVLAMIMPFVLIPTTVVLFLLSSVALLGLGLSKEMHRMSIRADRMDKDQFMHTFRGLATIRGYGLERRAIKAGMAQAEYYLKTAYFGSCADRWLHWKVDLMGSFIPFSCAVLALEQIEDLDPVLMGLVLYLSLQFSDKALDCLLGYGRIRNRLQWALERTRRFIRELESEDCKEPPEVVSEKRPAAGWPHSGAVEFVQYACSRSDGVTPLPTTLTSRASRISKPSEPQPEEVAVEQVLSRDIAEASNASMVPGLTRTTPLENGSIRTNSSVSNANTMVSRTIQASSSNRTTWTAEAMNGHGQPSASEASIATLIPSPGAATVVTGAHHKNLDAPLPALPAMRSASTLKANGEATTVVGFGPITCSIRSGEKIAVVGHSKSGKSTFVQSLFRMWDSAEEDRIRAARAFITNSGASSVAQKSSVGLLSKNKKNATFRESDPDLGRILVDGEDISQMGLSDLRPRIAILSQRGTVLGGTVRFNLDPRGEYEDAELNNILKTCFLSERLKLDTELITPATVNLPSLFGSLTANNPRPSRLSKYRKHFFRESREVPPVQKKKTERTPATISVSTGRELQAAVREGRRGDLSEIDPRLTGAMEVLESAPSSSSSEDDEEDSDEEDRHERMEPEEDEALVELDTNERQLLSLARILVQRPNIVVLDSCASKVTDLTAQRIDQIVVKELKHATVLSVGHRLDQIVARHHRVLVLDHGKMAEFDTPLVLLNKPDGAFRAICNPAGPNFSSLVALAKQQQL